MPSGSYETITLSCTDRVAHLTLSRPEQHNAMSAQLLGELTDALALVAGDPAISVVVLSGAGRSFSSGFDVAYAESGSSGAQPRQPVAVAADLRDRMQTLMAVWEHPKPVVAAVHGYCLGGATLLAAFSDLTIVAEDAVIGLPSIPLGGGYISPAWVHLVGPKRAKQLSFLAGEQINGHTAALWGFANYSVPPDELNNHVQQVAARISRTPLDVLTLKKSAVNRIVDATGWRAMLLSGAETDALAHLSPGVQAIRQHIKSAGLKQAIADFTAGDIDVLG